MLLRYILHNDAILDAAEPCLTPGQIGLLAGWGVFSTIRVSGGVLFAYERHFARMQRDAANLRVPFPQDQAWMQQRLLKLIEANGVSDATLRVVVVRNKGGLWQGPVDRDFDLIALLAPINDWGAAVKLGLVEQGRHAQSRFAGTKVLSWAFNLTWYEEAHVEGFDEVVLLDEHGHVSECTSANIFAAMPGGEVWTPPLTCGCLPGVTRELLVAGEVQAPGIKVIERAMKPQDLEAASEVFITSTTRDLLPVASIAGLNIKQGSDISDQLNQAFHNYRTDYVRGVTESAQA
jgi:branched-chain amino acid aminotransferase